jgi:hypothetical protein
MLKGNRIGKGLDPGAVLDYLVPRAFSWVVYFPPLGDGFWVYLLTVLCMTAHHEMMIP